MIPPTAPSSPTTISKTKTSASASTNASPRSLKKKRSPSSNKRSKTASAPFPHRFNAYYSSPSYASMPPPTTSTPSPSETIRLCSTPPMVIEPNPVNIPISKTVIPPNASKHSSNSSDLKNRVSADPASPAHAPTKHPPSPHRPASAPTPADASPHPTSSPL